MPLTLSGDGAVGPLSATEVGYLDGVTSAVQTQINGKLTTPGAWTSYTPTIGSQSGTITTASASGYYTQIGKTVHVSLNITITNKGTATGYATFSLPVTAQGSRASGVSGIEVAATGKGLTGAFASTSTGLINMYDGTTPLVNGYVLQSVLTYEAA
jgi:hypothetical protein